MGHPLGCEPLFLYDTILLMIIPCELPTEQMGLFFLYCNPAKSWLKTRCRRK